MATLSKRNGIYSVRYIFPAGQRHTVALGTRSERQATDFQRALEDLITARKNGIQPEPRTVAWLAGLGDEFRQRLAKAGLIEGGRSAAATLANFVREYVERRQDVKPATKEVWRQGEMGLLEFFGEDASLRAITPGDADNYKQSLIASQLASMTIRKRLQFATMIFRSAVRHCVITNNPFAEVTIKASMPDRDRFITVDETEKLLTAASTCDWQVIIGLARYGGLRCPSEVLSLRWQDINWESGRVLVTSPKTEHHPGKENRTIPLFPELRPLLAKARKAAPESAVYVVDVRMRASALGKSGWRNCNLRTHFERIIKRAGLKPWPRLFHNLRASRQTELAEQFPSHVVCEWLGNSEDVARKHYYQVRDDHFTKAIAGARSIFVATDASQAVSAGNRDGEKVALSRTSCHGSPRKADGEGFEPPVQFPVRQFSRLLPSTTRPPIRRVSKSTRALGNQQPSNLIELVRRVQPAKSATKALNKSHMDLLSSQLSEYCSGDSRGHLLHI